MTHDQQTFFRVLIIGVAVTGMAGVKLIKSGAGRDLFAALIGMLLFDIVFEALSV